MENKELALALVEEVRKDIIDLRGVKGLSTLKAAIQSIVHRVEAQGLLDGLKGAEKKELAMAVLDLALERFVPPMYLKLLPAFLRRKVLSWMVDRAVGVMNKYIKG